MFNPIWTGGGGGGGKGKITPDGFPKLSQKRFSRSSPNIVTV